MIQVLGRGLDGEGEPVPLLMSFSKTTDAVRSGIASVSPNKPGGKDVTTLLRDVVAAEIELLV